MARRGDKLREHILWTAKEVFLEMGFERASMDEVANRAQTSKRSLYAHFESKEKLFLAFVELVRGLFLGKLKMPGDYSQKPAEALVMFCGRYLELLLYSGSVQMCRVCMAETGRFPQGAAEYFDVLFAEVQTRLAAYLKSTFGLSARGATEAAQRLLGQILHPRFLRALFGIDPLGKHVDEEALLPDFDLKPIRKAVGDLLESLQNHSA
jgi:AcrR family transcriptional regulator